MTELATPALQPQFRTPGSDKWRDLSVDGQGEDELKNAKTAREDLTETLLASLQMQHIIVLAGSGTSIGSGGPSMNDLWNAAIGGEPGKAIKSIAEKVQYDLGKANIEGFLSKVEAYLQVVDNDADVKEFLNSCKRIILQECSKFLKVENLEAHETFLHRLSRRRVRDPRLKVFTTNYDLCFERAAGVLGGVALDGFSFTSPRQYDPRFFGYDIIRRPRTNEDQGNYLEGVFLLYKLHGSVNWARSEDGTIWEKIDPSPEEACLIYPANGKYQQSFLQPHLEALSQYLAALREPNTCLIVVGFGFNDDHLSEPLLSAVRSNPHLRLIIANPNILQQGDNKMNKYWQEFLRLAQKGEDILLINATFQDFVQLIPDLKSLTPADKLMTAFQSVVNKNETFH
jgi:hypothetical protein